jgi:hypothetical protein
MRAALKQAIRAKSSRHRRRFKKNYLQLPNEFVAWTFRHTPVTFLIAFVPASRPLPTQM